MNSNNHHTPSASGVMRDHIGHFGKDVAVLAQLQSELFQTEAREWMRTCLAPVAALATVATVLALASIPVLLLSLVWCLNEFGGLSMALSALIAGGSALLVSAIFVLAAWRVIRRQRGAFVQFRIELVRNIRWVKQMLAHPHTAGRNES